MKKVIVIAGTVDARRIIEELVKLNISVVATVTTVFGSELISGYEGVKVYSGRLDKDGMVGIVKEEGAQLLIDASHPYAGNASVNAIEACKAADVKYLRFERNESSVKTSNVIRVKDFFEAAKLAETFDGNIFLTVGSNNLEAFTNSITDFKERLFVRVLPESKVIIKCEQAGLSAKNIIAIKGPFTEEMNCEMFKMANAKVVVTKDSGEAGGTDEKLLAAEKLGIKVIMVERPKVEYGHKVSSIEEVVNYLRKFL